MQQAIIFVRVSKKERCAVATGRRVEEKVTFLKKYGSVARNLRVGLSGRKTAARRSDKLCEVSINTVRKVKALL